MQSVAPSPLPLEPAFKAYGAGSPRSIAATAEDPPEDPPKGMTVGALLGSGSVYRRKPGKERRLKGNCLARHAFIWGTVISSAIS